MCPYLEFFWLVFSRIRLITLLREKCQYLEFFCSVFSRIWDEYGEIRSFIKIWKFDRKKLVVQIYWFSEKHFLMNHYVKSVQIRSFFWYAFSRIQSENGKIRTGKTPHLDTFHTLKIYNILTFFIKNRWMTY